MADVNKVSKEKNTGMAMIAYIIFFVPLLTDAKNDSFVKYHVKQGLGLFILAMISSFTVFLGIGVFIGIFCFVLFVLGIMNAMNGKESPLPLIGPMAEKINI